MVQQLFRPASASLRTKARRRHPFVFAETWIIAVLRERKFFSIREVNEAIAEKLEELNNRPFQQMTGTRRSAYLEEEKRYMLPLPAVPFEAAVWSVAKVPKMDKAQMLRFSTCKFVDEGHHIILKGASGNGKTYIAYWRLF